MLQALKSIAVIVDKLLQVPYLGQRLVDEKGKAGPYHWLSYADVSKLRTEIGSGLLHYGMKSGSTMGLYSVNCRGAHLPPPYLACTDASLQALIDLRRACLGRTCTA